MSRTLVAPDVPAVVGSPDGAAAAGSPVESTEGSNDELVGWSDGGPPTTSRPPFGRRVLRGRPEDSAWVRPGLVALLVGTGVLYIWGLGQSGWANSFYSAAVQAGSKSWKAFFFGSSDASNFITVDKPPASLWVMEISARIFGVNAWSILVPQALEGVAAVGLLYATVRRWFGAGAGLIAGLVMAVTPVATLMFRFDNPDALLVLVLVGSAYALTRALEDGRTRWLVLAGSLVGFGFLTKMLQAFVIVPGFAVVYLIAGPPRLRKRLWQMLVAGAAIFVSAGWWVAIVELSPKSWRPYVGGSTNNSELNLIFGYNGLGRVTGNERGSVGGGGRNGTGQWGETGLLRMFNSAFGGQVSWLIPAALLVGFAGLVVTIRRERTDRTRAALLLWGSWLVVTGVLLSLSKGIIHPYYTVALTPAVGALIGIGAHVLWTRRTSVLSRLTMVAAIAVTAWWTLVLADRSPSFQPWLHTFVVVAAVVAGIAVLVARFARPVAFVAIVAALGAGLAVPVAYSLDTASVPHSGSIPSAGPSVVRRGSFGSFGFGGNRGPTGSPTRPPQGQGQAGGTGPGRPPADGTVTGSIGAPPGNTTGSTTDGGPGQMQGPPFGVGQTAGSFGDPGRPGAGFGGTQGGGIGGLLNSSRPSSALVDVLRTDASRYRWVLAIIGANQAAGYQLASGDPVMAIGGFNGTDPTPTLSQFQQYVAQGDIHYFITGGTGGRNASAAEITRWVERNFDPVTVGGTAMYDFTKPSS